MECVSKIVRSLNPDRRGTEKVIYVVMRPGVPSPLERGKTGTWKGVSVASQSIRMEDMTDDDDYVDRIMYYQQLGTDIIFTVQQMKLKRALR